MFFVFSPLIIKANELKIILVFVSTLNGKITQGDDPRVRSWSSKEDQKYYHDVWKNSKLIIMGSNTYNLNVITPSANRLITVMTRNPLLYRKYEIPGQLEFHDDSPSELVMRFSRYYDVMTVIGGPQVATSFLKENLIDEVWLTIEPKIFGLGSNLVVEEELEVNLQILTCENVNERGTMIIRYAVINRGD